MRCWHSLLPLPNIVKVHPLTERDVGLFLEFFVLNTEQREFQKQFSQSIYFHYSYQNGKLFRWQNSFASRASANGATCLQLEISELS